MSIAIETLEGLKRRIIVKLDTANIESQKKSRLSNLARKVKMNGYRPGKVPLKVVEKNYGIQVEQEIVSDLLNEQYRDVIKTNNIQTAGNPRIQESQDNPHEYEINFEVMPEISVKGLDSLEVTKLQASVEKSDLDDMLETLRKQQTKWVADTDRAAQNDDRIIVDFEGTMDGTPFNGGSAKATPIILGSNSMIPGFEEALIGAKAGETKTFTTTFPEDYRAEHLKGKTAEFTVTVNEVAKPELPEVDEEFIKKFGINSGSIDELKAELQKNMERELDNAIHNALKTEVMNALLAANEFDIPEALIENEVMSIAQRNNFPKPQSPEQAEQLISIAKQAFGKEAERRSRLGLILSQIVTDKKLKLDDKFVDKRLDLIAATYEDQDEVKEQFRKDPNMMSSISNMALEDQLLETLLQDAKVEIKPSNFAEIMKPKA